MEELIILKCLYYPKLPIDSMQLLIKIPLGSFTDRKNNPKICLEPHTHTHTHKNNKQSNLQKKELGYLGGSVSEASDFISGHDLSVLGFKPSIGLCADSSEPGASFGFCVSLSLCPSPTHTLCFSFSKINIKKFV